MVHTISTAFNHSTNPNFINYVITSVADLRIVLGYNGNDDIDDFIAYLDENDIKSIVEWERPRHWPKGRP